MLFRFETLLDIDECKRRLRRSITNQPQQGIEEKPLIVGHIFGSWFLLGMRRYVNIAGNDVAVKNSFNKVCFGRLHLNQKQTIISGYIGMHPVVIAFLSIWFGGLIIIGGYGILSIIKDIATGRSDAEPLYFICGALIFFLICGLMILIGGSGASKDDPKELIRFIKTTLGDQDSYGDN